MATHRSLNKLERKAHQSLHDMVEVHEDEEFKTGGATRDRFGKRHLVKAAPEAGV